MEFAARVFDGAVEAPVSQGDIDEIIRLSNEIDDLQAALAALAEDLLARLGGRALVRVGVHKLEVCRLTENRARKTSIMIDGAERWRRTVR